MIVFIVSGKFSVDHDCTLALHETIGLDEEKVKEYVRNQEKLDKQAEGLELDLRW